MRPLPFDEHGILHRRRALALGCSPAQLTRAVDAGELTRIGVGAYVAHLPEAADARHLLRARAAAERYPGVVFGDETAAVIHGLAMLKPRHDRLHLVSTARRRGSGLHVRRPCDGDEVEVVDGLHVVSRAATAAGVACTTTAGFAGALAVLDSALRTGCVRAEIEALLDQPRSGVGVARCALAHADPAAANPGESWSRAQMIEAGLPSPRLQHRFVDADGRLVAMSDFDWAGLLVGEFDGYGKYEDYNDDGASPMDVLRREKARENRLARLGVRIVRWDWSDLEQRRIAALLSPRLRELGLHRLAQ